MRLNIVTVLGGLLLLSLAGLYFAVTGRVAEQARVAHLESALEVAGAGIAKYSADVEGRLQQWQESALAVSKLYGEVISEQQKINAQIANYDIQARIAADRDGYVADVNNFNDSMRLRAIAATRSIYTGSTRDPGAPTAAADQFVAGEDD